MGSTKIALTDEMIEAVSAKFRLLGEPARLRLLQSLEAGECNVNELAAALGSSQPNVSRHLAALFEGGLVTRRREGNAIHYSIADPLVFELCALVCKNVRMEVREKWKTLDGRSR
jgi:DNA-binding transcriptional ArsR family regulator